MWVRIGATATVTAMTALAVAGVAWAPAPQARAAGSRGPGSFATYAGSAPLDSIKPGTVLKSRTLSYHVTTFPAWAPAALAWLGDRFAGSQAPNDCSQIAPGNSLAPVKPAH